jgi:hypothetical protein
MAKRTTHAHILAFPYAASLQNARLDALYEETHGPRRELVMDYHELRLSAPPQMFSHNGQPHERVHGRYLPRRIRFLDVQELTREGIYTHMETVPPDHVTRSLTSTWHWRTPDGVIYYLFGIRADEPSTLLVSARRCVSEERTGPAEEVELTRNWSPTPLGPPRPVPAPARLHRRFGGDPITLRLNGRAHHRRLFIGGVDVQSVQRPEVDAVLNLGEDPSRWAACARPTDRWKEKGEGRRGMDVSEITAEAQWVVEHLRTGRRVLVHCSAGMNRSATVCCAALILLEGLAAEAALDRVREHHPWARPDPYHWLALRWLAQTQVSGG